MKLKWTGYMLNEVGDKGWRLQMCWKSGRIAQKWKTRFWAGKAEETKATNGVFSVFHQTCSPLTIQGKKLECVNSSSILPLVCAWKWCCNCKLLLYCSVTQLSSCVVLAVLEQKVKGWGLCCGVYSSCILILVRTLSCLVVVVHTSMACLHEIWLHACFIWCNMVQCANSFWRYESENKSTIMG